MVKNLYKLWFNRIARREFVPPIGVYGGVITWTDLFYYRAMKWGGRAVLIFGPIFISIFFSWFAFLSTVATVIGLYLVFLYGIFIARFLFIRKCNAIQTPDDVISASRIRRRMLRFFPYYAAINILFFLFLIVVWISSSDSGGWPELVSKAFHSPELFLEVVTIVLTWTVLICAPIYLLSVLWIRTMTYYIRKKYYK